MQHGGKFVVTSMKDGYLDRFGEFDLESKAFAKAKKVMRNHTEKRSGKTLEEVAKHPHMD